MDGVAEQVCDVAVVGGGPVGTALAALLGQAGLTVFVGELETDIYPLPRAAHFDHEVMRIFQQLGIADEVMGSVVPVDGYVFQNGAGDVLLDFDVREPGDTGWNGYMMHQPGIERAIRTRIAQDPRVTLRTGIRFAGLDQDADGVRSTWRDCDGNTTAVRSRYLVGCDGGSSPVREGMGIGLDDLAFDEPWLVMDLIVDRDNDLPRHNVQYCDPERPTTYAVMGANRRRFEFMLKQGETAANMLTDEALEALLKPWELRGLQSIERKAVYRFHALIAQDWRVGHVFLAGDAAHQMPPFAGQGLCSGIRDAAALAWRLPLALASRDDALLLDSYQREREPHVRTIAAAAIATGRVVCTLDPAIAAARDAEMLAARAAGVLPPDIRSPTLTPAIGVSDSPAVGVRFFQPVIDTSGGPSRLDDVLGGGAWLIARSAPRGAMPEGVRGFGLDDAALAPFRTALETWLDEAGGADAVLVRADRYVFGTGDAEALLRAYAAQTGLAPIDAAQPQHAA